MCHVYPVASVLIHTCLFVVDCDNHLPPEGAKALVFVHASWAVENFHQGLWLIQSTSPGNQSKCIQAIGPIRVLYLWSSEKFYKLLT